MDQIFTHDLKVEFVPLESLKPFAGNPRKNAEAVEALVRSIEAFGYTNPILARRENKEIIAGHTRLLALKRMGQKRAPVIFLEMDETDARVYSLYDNKSVENTEWDFPKLAGLFVELGQLNIDMELTGFRPDEIEDIIVGTNGYKSDPKDDEIPEPPKEPKTKTGDFYLLGDHRLLCGDATKSEDVARLMDGQKADMVFIDPPYGVNYGHDQEKLQKLSGGKFSKSREKTQIEGDDLSIDEISKLLWRPSFKNLYENAQDDCSFYMTMCQGGDQMMMMMMMMMRENWQIKHELIWAKNAQVFSMGRLDYDYQHEPILFGWKKRHKFYGKGPFLTSIWQIPKLTKSDLHPTMKPVLLIENALLNSSKADDLCVDFFCGSGTTLIACEKLKRRCFGMEIDPLYCDVIIERWENFTGQKARCLN